MSQDYNNEHGNAVNDAQESIGAVQDAYDTANDAYETAKNLYDTGKKIYDYAKDNLGDGAKEAVKEGAKEAGKEAVKEGAKEAGKEAVKEGAKEAGKELAKEVGKEVGKQVAKTGGEVALSATGVGLPVALAVEGVSQVAGAVEKGFQALNKTVKEVTKQKKSGGFLMGIITFLLALILPLYFITSTPSLLLMPVTNTLANIIADVGGSFWVSLGNQFGLISDEFYESVKIAEIMDKYNLTEESNSLNVSSAVFIEMTDTLLALVHEDIKDEIKDVCQNNNYNTKLSLDTIQSIEEIYPDINYAEIICIADQNPTFGGAISYTELQDFCNIKENRKDLIIYELIEKEATYTVKEIDSMNFNDYSGLVGTGGEPCSITYEKLETTGSCNIAECNSTGYQYISHHAISHESGESVVLEGYYCDSHKPTTVSHTANTQSVNESDLEKDLETYRNQQSDIDTDITDDTDDVGSNQYTFRYYEVIVYPYALTEMYAFFDVEMNNGNITYDSMSNYDALNNKEHWLRTYVDEIDLGTNKRTPICNTYNYTSDLATGDIFMEDIVLENGYVRINLPNYYNQADSRWGSLRYWGNNTIKKSGCCLCAITMIADYFATDEEVTPITIQGYGSPIMTSDYKIVRTAVCSEYGFKTYINGQAFDVNICMQELEQGRPVIVYYPPTSNFTNNGHYAVINGYAYNENGEAIFFTYDSGSRKRTESGVTFADMVYNAQTMWSYGK